MLSGMVNVKYGLEVRTYIVCMRHARCIFKQLGNIGYYTVSAVDQEF